MQNSSTNSPITDPPKGTTFKVTVGLLSAFFILQIFTLAWHFLPILRKNIAAISAPEKIVAPTIPAPAPVLVATPVPTPEPDRKASPPEVDQDLATRITKLVSESDKAFRIGDYDLGLSSIKEADQLLPNDPGIMLRIGRLYEKSGNSADAAAVYQSVLKLPGLTKDLRSQTERRIAMLNLPAATPAPTIVAGESGSDMRDEFGLQPGAILGIVDTQLTDAANGIKNLRISIKSRPNKKIDPRQMTVHVFFYERDKSGEIVPTESKVTTEWLSPPVNWADDEPELLNATYTPPKQSASNKDSFIYAGYIVGVYYNNEIQDTRADPGRLAQQNPLPLYLKSQTQ